MRVLFYENFILINVTLDMILFAGYLYLKYFVKLKEFKGIGIKTAMAGMIPYFNISFALLILVSIIKHPYKIKNYASKNRVTKKTK